mgnify:CR=1 FL=1
MLGQGMALFDTLIIQTPILSPIKRGVLTTLKHRTAYNILSFNYFSYLVLRPVQPLAVVHSRHAAAPYLWNGFPFDSS